MVVRPVASSAEIAWSPWASSRSRARRGPPAHSARPSTSASTPRPASARNRCGSPTAIPSLGRRPHQRPPQRVLGVALDGRDQAERLVIVEGRRRDLPQAGSAVRDGARLVEADDADPRQVLQRLAALDERAARGRPRRWPRRRRPGSRSRASTDTPRSAAPGRGTPRSSHRLPAAPGRRRRAPPPRARAACRRVRTGRPSAPTATGWPAPARPARTMRLIVEDEASWVVRTSSTPNWFSVPAYTSSPTALSTGMLSPVTAD